MPTSPARSGKQNAVEDEPSTTDGKQAEYADSSDNEALREEPHNQIDVSANGNATPLVAGEDSFSEQEKETTATADHEGFLLVDGGRLSPTQWDDGPVILDWTQGEIDNLKRNNDQLAAEKQRDSLTLWAEQICLIELVRTVNRLLATLEGASEPPMAILNSAVFRLRNYTNTRSLRISSAHQNEGARH